MTDEGLCRVGWSTLKAKLDLGTDKEGFGFGGTGKSSFGRQFDSYGEVGSIFYCNFLLFFLIISISRPSICQQEITRVKMFASQFKSLCVILVKFHDNSEIANIAMQ